MAMTDEKFIERVKEVRPAYMKACEDYLDALERLDFEAAMKYSISAPNLMGMDMMAYIMNKLKECESTEGFMDEYEKITEELEEAMDTGE